MNDPQNSLPGRRNEFAFRGIFIEDTAKNKVVSVVDKLQIACNSARPIILELHDIIMSFKPNFIAVFLKFSYIFFSPHPHSLKIKRGDSFYDICNVPTNFIGTKQKTTFTTSIMYHWRLIRERPTTRPMLRPTTRPMLTLRRRGQVWFYITWLVFIAGAVGAGATLAFLACSGLLWFTFLRSWRSDPGVITATKQDKFRVSVRPWAALQPPEAADRAAFADHHRAVGVGARRLRAGAVLLGVPGAAAAALQALLRVQPLRGQVRPPLPVGRQLHRGQQPPLFRRVPGQPAAHVRVDAVGGRAVLRQRVRARQRHGRRRRARVGALQRLADVGHAERRLPPVLGDGADRVPAVPGECRAAPPPPLRRRRADRPRPPLRRWCASA